ncbi:MAG: nitrile hydratase accessory protein [Alphaproteobacteria bacterium]|nr:nitrile hydratase accessory protein [Alphaproteobacteria bacterium]
MSQPERLAALPSLPRDADGPVFAEPWQAQAFALTLQLCEAGRFTWSEWVETLSSVLRDAGPDDGSRYYEHWLTALERLSLGKSLTDRAALDARTRDWAEAYRTTPHGQPVEFLPKGVSRET